MNTKYLKRTLSSSLSGSRVVVTGIGCLTPLGIGVEDSYKAILANKTAIRSQNHQERYGIKTVGCPMPEEAFTEEFKEKNRLKSDDIFFSQTHYAFREALLMSGLWEEGRGLLVDEERVGLNLSYCLNAMERIQDISFGESSTNLKTLLACTLKHELCSKYGIHGNLGGSVQACSASLMSVGDSYRMIKDGYQDAVIAGGFDMTVGGFGDFSLHQLGAYSQDLSSPETYLKAFDKNRRGTCAGDGGAFLVIEKEDTALARGAKPLCEIVGYHTSSYGEDIVRPSLEGIQKLFSNLTRQTGWKPEDIDLINSHATGTLQGDPVEMMGIKTFLGSKYEDILEDKFATPETWDLSNIQNTSVNALKGYFGHMILAAGATELAMSLRGMQDNIALATANLANPIDEEVNFVMGGQHRSQEIRRMVKIGLGFGANNSAMAFQKYESP